MKEPHWQETRQGILLGVLLINVFMAVVINIVGVGFSAVLKMARGCEPFAHGAPHTCQPTQR